MGGASLWKQAMLPLPDHVKSVAVHLYKEVSLCPNTVETLRAIDSRFPTLSFRDFVAAVAAIEWFENQRKDHSAPPRH
jgi:hypothetical protein